MNGPTDNYLSIVLSVAIIMWYFTPSIMYVTDLRLIQHIRSVELFDVIVLLFYVAVMNWPVNRDFDRYSNGDADDISCSSLTDAVKHVNSIESEALS